MCIVRLTQIISSWTFEAVAHLNNLKEASPYRKENTITNINLVMLFKETISIHSESYTTPIDTNASLLTIKVDGTHGYHWALIF